MKRWGVRKSPISCSPEQVNFRQILGSLLWQTSCRSLSGGFWWSARALVVLEHCSARGGAIWLAGRSEAWRGVTRGAVSVFRCRRAADSGAGRGPDPRVIEFAAQHLSGSRKGCIVVW